MSTTGAIIAGTGTSVARSTGTAWTNPGNITANDNTNATCNSGAAGSAYLRASNFGFNIPANSLIQGFTVVFEMSEASAGGETVSVQIVNASAAAAGTAKTQSVNNNNVLTAYTLGSGTDVWGTSLTASDINDTDFGVYLWYETSHNTAVDYISINVNYEPPISGSLAATETGADTASINGKVLVSGSFAATETGDDTAAFNGTVADTSVTGSFAVTEVGNDTASISGNILVSGSLSATETGNDTAVVNGKVLVSGSFAATETGLDVASFTGVTTSITGSFAATETGLDVASFAGNVIDPYSVSFSGTGDMEVSISLETSISASITGIGNLQASLSGVFTQSVVFSGTGSLTASLYRLGEQWVPVPADVNTWTAVNVGGNTWTDNSISSDNWSASNVSTNTWTDKQTGSNTWQG